jgi:uncharacterized protein (AIM24 family)
MYCPSCGSETGDVKFCPSCGENLESAKTKNEDVPSPHISSENAAEVSAPQILPKNKNTKYSINEFVANTQEKQAGNETFELENNYLLNVNLQGKIWTKKGAMVAYTGDVKFRREGTMEHGLNKFVKKAVTGESSTLMKVKGQGKVYLADMGKEITVLNLQNEKIYVNGNDLLAFEEQIDWDITMMTKGSSMMSGGLFNIRLKGTGMVALTTHFTPMTLAVTPDQPVYTDPNATVAWSGGLSPSIKADLDFKALIGKDSGETFQMKFEGNGFVIVQPYEEY